MAEFFLLHKQFDAFALYYLIKIVHVNSIIYKLEGFDLYFRLKEDKMLPLNFSKERYKTALKFLAFHGYIYESSGHVAIKKVRPTSGRYKSVIKYNKENINFNIVQRLLIKEGLLYSKYKQEKAVQFREKMTTHEKRHQRDLIKPIGIANEGTLKSLGESYQTQASFTYRTFAKKYGMSLAWIGNSIDWIRKNTELKIYKLTECKKRIAYDVDYDTIKKSVYPNCYSYATKSGNVIAIFGSSITT